MSFKAYNIIDFKYKGKKQVVNLEMKSKFHNFIVNGIVSGNSHAFSYSVISARCLYLKTHFPLEYYSAVLSNIKTGDESISEYVTDGRNHGIIFMPININKSKIGFTIYKDKIIFGFNKVKGINKDSNLLVKLQPFSSFDDYLNRFGFSKKTGETLIKIGAFDIFDKNRKKLLKYFEYRRNNLKNNFGLNKRKFGIMYKELTGAKSCSKKIHKIFEIILEGKTSLTFDEIKNNIEKFEELNLNRDKIYEYLKENEEDIFGYQKKLEEFNNIEDFDDLEKCSYEKEYYSLYFSHPLIHTQKYGFTIKKAKEGIYTEVNRKRCLRVEAIIKSIKTKTTKNSNPYYIISLEDEEDSISLVLWENEYNLFKDLLFIGNMIMAEVKKPEGKFPTWNLLKNGEIKKIKTKYDISNEEEIYIKGQKDFDEMIKNIK